MSDGIGEVWTEYDYKRVLAITHSQCSEAYQTYYRARLTGGVGGGSYDTFLSTFSRLYGDIRPFLVDISEGKDVPGKRGKRGHDKKKLKVFIEIMDESRRTMKRLKPSVGIQFFDYTTQFLKEWGLLDIEKSSDTDPSAALQ